MNKLLIVGLMILLFSSPVMAQGPVKPWLLPDNPFYPLQRAIERIQLMLTFDPEDKARLHLQFAERRLAELNETLAKNQTRYVEKLKIDYDDEINETENEMNRTIGLGRNVTALAEHVCNMTYKHILVLQKVLAKAPEPAKIGIERAINASVRGHENCLGRLEKILNETNETVRKFNCTVDAECLNLTVKCPAALGYQISCFIPENRTVGFCRCQATWKKHVINCTDDAGCRGLVCPMVVGNDTAICLNNKCVCGARWQLTNRTEWRERFGEEWTNQTGQIQQQIRMHIEITTRTGR